jgi:hypothetical protein
MISKKCGRVCTSVSRSPAPHGWSYDAYGSLLLEDMAGIAIQQFFIFCFFYVAVNFQRTMNRTSPSELPPYSWRAPLFSMYGALTLISVSFTIFIHVVGISLIVIL